MIYRFRIWISAEIKEKDFYDLKDARNKCLKFFEEFAKRHLDNEKFEETSFGYDYQNNTRDITFAKYFEDPIDAERCLNLLKKAKEQYSGNIFFEENSAYIDNKFLESSLKNLDYSLTAYKLLKNI